MTKLLKLYAAAALGVVLGAGNACAFALLGPFDSWQVGELHYQITPGDGNIYGIGDLGGPQNLGEEYRWVVPEIYYGVDAAFLNYFGLRGSQEIDKAMAILNAIPNYSSLSENISEYPLEAARMNYQAAALGLYDLKSGMLTISLEWLGLANPERFVWTLRGRDDGGAPRPQFTYYIINRNFDPVTWEPSRYVNGRLYTFRIMVEFGAIDRSDAQEQLVDPAATGWTSVAGAFQGLFYPGAGSYYNTLTRDDIGGLRYIYRKNNYNNEGLPASAFGGVGGGSVWSPVTTNVVAPGAVVPDFILRQGVDKIRFIKRSSDTLLGNFYTPITNSFTSVYITNGVAISQRLSRQVGSLDYIVTTLGESGGGPGDTGSGLLQRSNLGYVNSQNQPPVANGESTFNQSQNGPGYMVMANVGDTVFSGSVQFVKVGPSGQASGGFFVNERLMTPNARWASFDGTTNAPVIYPSGTSIKAIEDLVLGGGN